MIYYPATPHIVPDQILLPTVGIGWPRSGQFESTMAYDSNDANMCSEGW